MRLLASLSPMVKFRITVQLDNEIASHTHVIHTFGRFNQEVISLCETGLEKAYEAMGFEVLSVEQIEEVSRAVVPRDLALQAVA